MSNIGVALAGGNGARREDDFYPTPDPDAVIGALLAIDPPHSGVVWEPACGDGAMVDPLVKAGYKVVATDLVDRGYPNASAGLDFTTTKRLLADAVVTNPPFKLAGQFVRAAHRIGASYIALLLKMTYWNAGGRYDLFEAFQPTGIYPLTWRLDFSGGGASTMDVMWCVWNSTRKGSQVFRPLLHPTKAMERLLG